MRKMQANMENALTAAKDTGTYMTTLDQYTHEYFLPKLTHGKYYRF
jgi:hypothetical protein